MSDLNALSTEALTLMRDAVQSALHHAARTLAEDCPESADIGPGMEDVAARAREVGQLGDAIDALDLAIDARRALAAEVVR